MTTLLLPKMRASPHFLSLSSLLLVGFLGCSAGDEEPPLQGFGAQSQGGFVQGGMGGAGSTSGTGGNTIAGMGGAGQGGTTQGGAGQGGSTTAGQGGATTAGQGGSTTAGVGGAGTGGVGGDPQGGAGGSMAGNSGQGGGTSVEGMCATSFTVKLSQGAQNVRVAGEWNQFDLTTATQLNPSSSGDFEGTVSLPPGLHAYKIIYDDGGGTTQWVLDPGQGRRKYVGGIENSAIKVHNCTLPSLQVVSSETKRVAVGQGSYSAKLNFKGGTSGAAVDTAGYTLSLRTGGNSTALAKNAYQIDAQGNVTLNLKGLADGKYRVTITPTDKSGKKGEPVMLPFWIEAEEFKWEDALIYMVMTDRFRDGDPKNNGGKTPSAEPSGDYQGGDLEGLRQVIADGTLDQLGVRAIWLTPFQTNPTTGYKAADGVHTVTGYHGYWPIKAREVDPRLGGAAALSAMVEEAHKHGIRILQDYVVNHVHEEHEYFKQHPEWFRTGCVCGTANCDWTEKALECLFAPYMPDVNHTVPEANAQFVADAEYWLNEFDLDGLRVDAVKHVEEVATRNLAVEVRETFEKAGTKYFMMGETAMGWSDCSDPCNDENYGTISRYIGPFGLDGQFDFVLYHGVSYRVFASEEKGMLHADYWTAHGEQKWPQGAIMTPYIGSHDTPRFVTLADPNNAGKAGNQWSDVAQAPQNAMPLERLRVAMAWMMGLPGAPLLYYGDEYGQWGGADPNNRLFWREESKLSPEEKAMLSFTRKLGQARRTIPALRRGAYVPYSQLAELATQENAMIFGRKSTKGDAAIVGINRGNLPIALTAKVKDVLALPAGTKLKDALGGPDVIVDTAGKAVIMIPAHGAVMLAP